MNFNILDIIISLFLILSIIFTTQIYLFKNPVYSVFSFIIVIGCLMLVSFLFGIEFFPLATLIIYVGAIAVLFLFIVMLLPRLYAKKIVILKNLIFCIFSLIISYKAIQFVIFFVTNFFYNLEFLLLGFNSLIFAKYFDIFFIATELYTTYLFEFIIITLILFIGLLAPSLITSRQLQYGVVVSWFDKYILDHKILFFILLILIFILTLFFSFLHYISSINHSTMTSLSKTYAYRFIFVCGSTIIVILYLIFWGYTSVTKPEGLVRLLSYNSWFMLIVYFIQLNLILNLISLDNLNNWVKTSLFFKSTLGAFYAKYFLVPYINYLLFIRNLPVICKIRLFCSKLPFKFTLTDFIAVLQGGAFQYMPHLFITATGLFRWSLEILGLFSIGALGLAVVESYKRPNEELANREVLTCALTGFLMVGTLLLIVTGHYELIALGSACPLPVKEIRHFYIYILIGIGFCLLPSLYIAKKYTGRFWLLAVLLVIFFLSLAFVCMYLYMIFIDLPKK